jgi:hypothetical protein
MSELFSPFYCPGTFAGLACPVAVFDESLCGLPVCFVLQDKIIAQVITTNTDLPEVQVWPDRSFDNATFTIADPVPCFEYVSQSKNETLTLPTDQIISKLTNVIDFMRNGSIFIPRTQASHLPVNSPPTPVWVVNVREPSSAVIEIIEEEDASMVERTAVVVEEGEVNVDVQRTASEPQLGDNRADSTQTQPREVAAAVNPVFNPPMQNNPNPRVRTRTSNPRNNGDAVSSQKSPIPQPILSASQREGWSLIASLVTLVL